MLGIYENSFNIIDILGSVNLVFILWYQWWGFRDLDVYSFQEILPKINLISITFLIGQEDIYSRTLWIFVMVFSLPCISSQGQWCLKALVRTVCARMSRILWHRPTASSAFQCNAKPPASRSAPPWPQWLFSWNRDSVTAVSVQHSRIDSSITCFVKFFLGCWLFSLQQI